MSYAPGATKPGGSPLALVIEPLLDGRVLRVTDPSGKSHTHGADDGRTGWKRHAVRDGRAACGLVPMAWGGDLFEDEMEICMRCAVAIGACKMCRGSQRVSIQITERCSEVRVCACAMPERETDFLEVDVSARFLGPACGHVLVVSRTRVSATDTSGHKYSLSTGARLGFSQPFHDERPTVWLTADAIEAVVSGMELNP